MVDWCGGGGGRGRSRSDKWSRQVDTEYKTKLPPSSLEPTTAVTVSPTGSLSIPVLSLELV